MKEVQIALSKTKMILMLIGCLVFVGLGVWFLLAPETFKQGLSWGSQLTILIGVLSISFFGLCGLFLVRKLGDTKPALIINEEGIHDNSSAVSVGLIKWEDLENIIVVQVSGQKIIMLMVKNPEFYIEQAKGGFKKRLMKMNNSMYGSPISLTANGMKIKHADLYELLGNYWKMSREA